MCSNYGMTWGKAGLLLSISAMSYAGVTPETYNVYLSSTNHHPQAVSFYNPSDQDVAVRARLYKSPMNAEANRPILAGEAMRFTPQRFVVPAHGSAAVEVEYQGAPRDIGDEYSLEVMPLKAKALESGKATLPLTFLTTQQINLHVLPEDIRPAMVIHYKGDHAILENTGNVSIWIQSLKACDSSTACHTIPDGSQVRFFPGAWLDLGAVKPSAGFQVDQVWGNSAGKEEKQTIHLPTRI